MFQAQSGLLHRGIQAGDLAIVGLAHWGASYFSLSLLERSADAPSVWLQCVPACLAWAMAAYRADYYRSRRTEGPGNEVTTTAVLAILAVAIGTLVALSVWGHLGFDPLAATAFTALGVIAFRGLARTGLWWLRLRGFNYRNAVIVGACGDAGPLVEFVRAHRRFGLHVLGAFHLPGEDPTRLTGVTHLGPATGLQDYLLREQVDAVWVCPSATAWLTDVNAVLAQCDEAGVNCTFLPFGSTRHLAPASSWIGGKPAFAFQPQIGSPVNLALKRLLDVAVSLTALLLLLPVFLAIALAIKLDDGGPVFFRQIRVGKDGRKFFCYKFRSMRIDAEATKHQLRLLNEEDGPAFKMKNDPRITRIGRLLRKYSLDELPQIFSVLRGHMSIVGPRPPVPDEVERYAPWQRRRISVKPGLTCYWQVQGRNRVSFDEWMAMDLRYIDNWSVWLDIKLILRTFPAVFRGTGS